MMRFDLEKVTRDLKEIKDQSRWLMFFFRNLNKAKMGECVTRLQETSEKFQLSNDLHAAEDLQRIQTRLEDLFGLTRQMAHHMGKIQTEVHSIDSQMDEMREMMNQATQCHIAALFLPMGGMSMKPRHFHRHDPVKMIREYAFWDLPEWERRLLLWQ